MNSLIINFSLLFAILIFISATLSFNFYRLLKRETEKIPEVLVELVLALGSVFGLPVFAFLIRHDMNGEPYPDGAVGFCIAAIMIGFVSWHLGKIISLKRHRTN